MDGQLHTVVETQEFIVRSRRLMNAGERRALIDYLAANPDAGELLVGTGGARKLRWAAGGKGKSGGVRVITYYAGPRLPIFLLTVFGKSEKANLVAAERNELRSVLSELASVYHEGARRYVKSRR